MPHGEALPLDRPHVVGILNLTPDSFSDGGRFDTDRRQGAGGSRSGGCHSGGNSGGRAIDVDAVVRSARAMVAAGAAMLDVGGESTRPGAARVSVQEQIRRVIEPLRAVREALPAVPMSIDTTLAPVAEAALNAGADMINDVSAGREDAGMLGLAADRGVPIILMHMLGEPGTMQDAPRYDDVVEEVLAFLTARTEAAIAAGVAAERLVIDPGIGFGKTVEHNLQLLAALPRFVATGYPVMLGASRKRFIAAVSPDTEAGVLAGAGAIQGDRLGGSIAATLAGVAAGVCLHRVHDVAAHRQTIDVTLAIRAQANRQLSG